MSATSEEVILAGARLDRRLLSWLLLWVRPFKVRVAGAVLLVLAGSPLQIVGPFLTAAAIDLYLRPQPTGAAQKVLHGLHALHLPAEGGAGLATLAVLYLVSLTAGAVLLVAQARIMLTTALRDAEPSPRGVSHSASWPESTSEVVAAARPAGRSTP